MCKDFRGVSAPSKHKNSVKQLLTEHRKGATTLCVEEYPTSLGTETGLSVLISVTAEYTATEMIRQVANAARVPDRSNGTSRNSMPKPTKKPFYVQEILCNCLASMY